MSECDWPPDWPPPDSPDWRPLLDAIEFLHQRFRLVKTLGVVLHDAWVSGDLLSLREKLVEGRVVREPLCGKKIYFELSYSIDSPGSYDDIVIELPLERLHPDEIFAWWPDVERLRKPADAQPEPAAQPEPVEPEPEQPPTLRQQMIIAILRDALGDNFTTDDIIGKTKIVEKGWDAERKAPLGDASRRNDYSVPSYKTVGYTIEDYLRRPLAYPRRR